MVNSPLNDHLFLTVEFPIIIPPLEFPSLENFITPPCPLSFTNCQVLSIITLTVNASVFGTFCKEVLSIARCSYTELISRQIFDNLPYILSQLLPCSLRILSCLWIIWFCCRIIYCWLWMLAVRAARICRRLSSTFMIFILYFNSRSVISKNLINNWILFEFNFFVLEEI